MSNDLTKFNPGSFDELLTFCKMLSRTQLVPRALHDKVDDILAIVMMGADLRLSPMQSLQNISCINGKVTIWGDGLLAIVQGHPNFAGMKEWIEHANSPDAVAYCLVKRRCGDEVMETVRGFSVDQAKRASLWGNKGPWSQYPERMLQMRARAFACRDAFADALRGIMPREEVMDYNDRPAGKVPMRHAALDAVMPKPVDSTPPEAVEAEYIAREEPKKAPGLISLADLPPKPEPKKPKKPRTAAGNNKAFKKATARFAECGISVDQLLAFMEIEHGKQFTEVRAEKLRPVYQQVLRGQYPKGLEPMVTCSAELPPPPGSDMAGVE